MLKRPTERAVRLHSKWEKKQEERVKCEWKNRLVHSGTDARRLPRKRQRTALLPVDERREFGSEHRHAADEEQQTHNECLEVENGRLERGEGQLGAQGASRTLLPSDRRPSLAGASQVPVKVKRFIKKNN